MAEETLQVACPDCGALNRVPKPRLRDKGRCGACHEPLFPGRPITLTATSLDHHLHESDLPLLVDFGAEWCGPCRVMAPVIAAAASELEPEVRIGTLDTEAETEIATRFAIRSVPTLVLLHHGQELARSSGVMTLSRLIAWAREHASTIS